MSKSDKAIFIPGGTVASEKMIHDFIGLMDVIDPKLLGRKLRLITLSFVAAQSQDLAEDFPEFIDDLNIFFDFLDTLDDELSLRRSK